MRIGLMDMITVITAWSCVEPFKPLLFLVHLGSSLGALWHGVSYRTSYYYFFFLELELEFCFDWLVAAKRTTRYGETGVEHTV